MAIPPAVSQTRQTLAGILAGATVATGVFAAGLAVTAPQTQSATGTVVADSEDTTGQTTAPTTSTVTSPGTSTGTSHTSTRGS
ncbi:MAG: hypothetical protein LWW77_04465 [Propionibacteriales bacterium]|nr:hypothetical protein [Propionibacteriales bacterium]